MLSVNLVSGNIVGVCTLLKLHSNWVHKILLLCSAYDVAEVCLMRVTVLVVAVVVFRAVKKASSVPRLPMRCIYITPVRV